MRKFWGPIHLAARQHPTMTVPINPIEIQAVNTLRVFGAELPSLANSGHPGAPMGCAAIVYALYNKHMKHSPKNPKWINRDRFILSNGHACGLQYSILHLCGYAISRDDLLNFRQLNSITPGHPEATHTPGIEVTTGPLGQGFASAVGLAIATKHLAATYNKKNFELFNNRTFVVLGDGCMQEGITSEAASLAGHLKLNNLIALYDDNKITIDGSTSLSFTEDVRMRFASYGWNTLTVHDGHKDINAINNALAATLAPSSTTADFSPEKPTLILVNTIIGYGSKNENTSGVHGSPLKADDLAQLKTELNMDATAPLMASENVIAECTKCVSRGEALVQEWDTLFAKYAETYPAEHATLARIISGSLPEDWKSSLIKALPQYSPQYAAMATRQASGVVLNAVANLLPEVLGGSADLTPSNLTFIKSSEGFQHDAPHGRYLHFGVREHAMAAICNGLAAYGIFVPFCATFLNFISYAMGAVTISALSNLGVIYIMTHDSIGLGEDGPTHQPTNSLAMIRSLPNSLALRPADAKETIGAYIVAIERRDCPSILALSRQNLPHLTETSPEKVYLGAYPVFEQIAAGKENASSSSSSSSSLDLILLASGSEVSLAMDAAKILVEKHQLSVRVVSAPSHELFDCQPIEYRRSVLTPGVPVVSIEALSTKSWEAYAHFTIGMTTFGKSAPAKQLFSEFGFSVDNVVEKSIKVTHYFAKLGSVPELYAQRPSLAEL